MQPDLNGVTVAVLGGDARETILAERLAALGSHCLRWWHYPSMRREI